MSRSIDIDLNQSEINNESNQPITMFVLNCLDQSDVVNEINLSKATLELENLNQSSVCFVDSPGTNKTKLALISVKKLFNLNFF